MRNLDDYPFEIRPLTEDEGGGYLINFPDFNVCFSDGDTIEEAIASGRDALNAAILSLEDLGLPVPEPSSGGCSGRFSARVPKTLHAKLVARAKREQVSLNMLVVAILAEGLCSRSASV